MKQNNLGKLPEASIVLKYLQKNPEFLIENPELLEILKTSPRWKENNDDNIVDIQTLMLDRMRTKSTTLKNAADLLISTTRSNMMIQTRTHAAVIAMLEAKSIESLVNLVSDELPIILDLDAVSLCMEKSNNNLQLLDKTNIKWIAQGYVNKIMGDRNTKTKLIENSKRDEQVFGRLSNTIKSTAYGRLQFDEEIFTGFLALGSRTPGAFHEEQGTELLNFTTRAFELILNRWLNIEEKRKKT
jgi:uncharacterized protein YigA (DUF484 family)